VALFEKKFGVEKDLFLITAAQKISLCEIGLYRKTVRDKTFSLPLTPSLP
jgi:hypothetical protein